VTSGLIGLARQFHTVHGSAQALQGQLNKIKLLTMGGAAVAGTGLFGLALIGKTVPAAKEYVHQLQQMNIAGMKQVEIAKATSAAWAAAKSVPTSDATENLVAIRELRMVFGDTNHAIANMPTVQRLQAVLANTKGGMAGGQDEAYTVAKALEMKGAVRTPGEFNTQADMMAKAIVASGGKVGAQDFLSAFKYGRSATQGWNDAFAYSILPTLIQEMKTSGGSGGSGGPGNALMSAYAAVVGGTVPKKALAVWGRLGLLDPSKVVTTTTGDTKGLAPGGIRGGALFQSSPYEWTQTILLPALKKAGYQTPAEQRQVLQYLFPNRTAGFVMGQMALQPWKFDRDQRLIHGAQGLGAYGTLIKNDPVMQELALHKQFNNLMTSLGIAVLPMLIAGLRVLIPALQGLSKWLFDHPKLTKALVIGFGALSAAMAIGGTVMLIAGGFAAIGLAAPVVAAILPTVAAGLTWLAAGAALSAMATGKLQKSAFQLGLTLGDQVRAWIKARLDLGGAWTAIKNGIGGFVSWVIAKAKELGGIVGQFFGGHAPAAGAKSPSGTGSAFVHPGPNQYNRMLGDVHMDGKKVGKIVWQHQANEMGRPPAGGSVYDPGHSLTPVGAGAFAI
jgi:hypothetical protein